MFYEVAGDFLLACAIIGGLTYGLAFLVAIPVVTIARIRERRLAAKGKR